MRSLPCLLIAGCVSSPVAPKGGPRGLHASEHIDEAHTHEDLARTRYIGHEEDGSPWARHWDTAADNEQAARVHRSQAADLRTAYERACRDRTPAQASISPLDRYGVGGTASSTTVVLYLDRSAGPAERLLGDLECHRAWMMLAPEEDADDPLDLPGLVIDAKGDLDGITVSVSARDPDTAAELHRRCTHLLERRAPRADVR